MSRETILLMTFFALAYTGFIVSLGVFQNPAQAGETPSTTFGFGEIEYPTKFMFGDDAGATALCLDLEGKPRLFLGDCETPYDGNDKGLRVLMEVWDRYGIECKPKKGWK